MQGVKPHLHLLETIMSLSCQCHSYRNLAPNTETPQNKGVPLACRDGLAPGMHPTAHRELRVCQRGARSNDHL